nr:hypothetical protein [uncultured Porphyromonas sp.]
MTAPSSVSMTTAGGYPLYRVQALAQNASRGNGMRLPLESPRGWDTPVT